MNEEKIIKQFSKLSEPAKKEASDFIAYLYKMHVIKSKKNSKQNNIGKLKFYGIWKDREDMKNSTKWVRDVRKKNWKSK